MIFIFYAAVFFLFYVYFLYPIFLMILAGFYENPEVIDSDNFKKILIVIPAHNEEGVIAKKLDNHMQLDYPKESFKILVISDSSTDKTSEIVKNYMNIYSEQIELYEVSDGLGKTNAINKALTNRLDSDIYVFSDANVMLKQDALKWINLSFANEKVGGVAGQLTYVNDDILGAAEANGLYWRYEEWLKKLESYTGSLIGADGSIFSIRSELFQEHPIHVLDDFCSSMGVIVQGFSLKFNSNIKAFEKGAEQTSEEFPRKIRISNRSYNSFRYMMPKFLNSLSFFDIWKLYSHKVLRWYSLFFMILALTSSMFLFFSIGGEIWSAIFFGQLAFYFLAFLSLFGFLSHVPILRKVAVIAEYFTMANLAAGIGIIQSLVGIRTLTWRKAASTRSI